MAKTTTIWNLPRNNLKAALAFYKAKDGPLTIDEWRVIWRSQDDPAELEALAKDWNVENEPAPNLLDDLLG
jgi:hypothetical protein